MPKTARKNRSRRTPDSHPRLVPYLFSAELEAYHDHSEEHPTTALNDAFGEFFDVLGPLPKDEQRLKPVDRRLWYDLESAVGAVAVSVEQQAFRAGFEAGLRTRRATREEA